MSEEYCVIESERIDCRTKDNIINLVLHTLKKEKQVLIFNNSKRSSEATAEKIADSVRILRDKDELEKVADKILKSIQSPTKQCKRLAKCVMKGVAFHHSGLVSKQRDLIEKNFKKGLIKVISSTPTLCLPKETCVWSNGKNVSIENLADDEVYALKGTDLFSMKPEKVENNGKAVSLVEIESVSGHKIKSTFNHKFLVRRGGEKLILPSSEIRETDLIATVGKIDVCEKKVKYLDFVLDNELSFDDREISKEVFYFLGSMLGDGYSGAEFNSDRIEYKGSPCIVGVDKEIFFEVVKVCKELGVSVRESKNSYGVPQLVLGKNKWFREFLVRSGVDVGGNKHITEVLKVASRECVADLLMGLFDTDGYVEKRGQLGYSSISKRLVKDIQWCLYRFNIVSRIRKRDVKSMNVSGKTYNCKESYELVIAENSSILNFSKYIGFKIKRKQEVLDLVVKRINSNLLYKKCEDCGYVLYNDLFSGRTKEQKEWGNIKLSVIKELYLKGALSSNELKCLVKDEIRKNSSRLNHHYELINKTRSGSREWIWELNDIGKVIADKLETDSFENIFENNKCLICGKNLTKERRKNWKNSNKEGDIYWDQIRSIREVRGEFEVFDVVLPSDGSNDHMFVAEGFVTHNSAGLNLPAYKVIIKDYKRYSQRGMMDIPVLEFHQMSGRAGRPGKEKIGRAVVNVKNDDELLRVVPKYIFGDSEEILSKLAVEPTLKMYVLSLMSMDMINTKDEIEEFFSNTLYAYQYKDLKSLNYNVFRIIEILKDYKFVQQDDDYYMATPLGKKVSQLYLNPDTANYFIENLGAFVKVFEKSNVTKYDLYSLVNFVVNTVEMRPLFRVLKAEGDYYAKKIQDVGDSLVVKFDPFEVDYEMFMNSIKTTDLFMDWISEAPEDYVVEKFSVTPGELNYKLEVVDWLIYCLGEIAYLKKEIYFRNYLGKLRVRFKAGVKEELLALILLKGVGRVRARKLFKAGFKKVDDLKKAEVEVIGRVVGNGVAQKIKEQVSDSSQSFEKVVDSILVEKEEKPKEINARESVEKGVVDETFETGDESFESGDGGVEKRRGRERNKSLTDFFRILSL